MKLSRIVVLFVVASASVAGWGQTLSECNPIYDKFKEQRVGDMETKRLAVAGWGQTLSECNPIYDKFKEQRVGDMETKRLAVATGKDYVLKCSTLPDNEAVLTYVKNQMAKMEAALKIYDAEQRFNKALAAKDNDGIIAGAKELLTMDRPYALDLMLDIATVGFDMASASPPNNKYRDDALKYAKLSLEALGAGKTSGNKDNFGYYVSYKNDACDGKANSAAWMNYTIGSLTYEKETDKAVPYLFKASNSACGSKGFADAYRRIGAWYISKVQAMEPLRLEKVKAAGDKETDETNAIRAKQDALTDLAIDAYSRAYNAAAAAPKPSQSYQDAIKKKLDELLKYRFGEKVEPIDTYLAAVKSKPMPDPSTAR